MNQIGIYNESNMELKEIEQLPEFLEFAANYQGLSNLDFNIILVDEKRIQEINKDYRNMDRVTDVISFALEDTKDISYEGYRLLGDIYICVEKVLEQAKSYGHSIKRELLFLSVHGLLHLLGYDHMNLDEEKEMFALQDKILEEYGVTR